MRWLLLVPSAVLLARWFVDIRAARKGGDPWWHIRGYGYLLSAAAYNTVALVTLRLLWP